MTTTTLQAFKLRFWFLLLAHVAIATVFITKYGVRYGFNPILTSFAYTVTVLALVEIYRRALLSQRVPDARQILVGVILLTALLAVFMYQFDTTTLRNARHASLDSAISRILDGVYPYQGPLFTPHSAFPCWFFLTMPFYLVGDSGLIVLFALPLLAWTLWKITPELALFGILLVVCSPQFLYEVAVRSEIAVNAILLAAALLVLDYLRGKPTTYRLLACGILMGVLLSTRGIAFLIFSVYLGYVSVKSWRQCLVIAGTAVTVFGASLLPFAISDWDQFCNWGPIAHQLRLTGLPLLVLFMAVLVPFWLARRARSIENVFEICAVSLSLVVFAAGAAGVIVHGAEAAIMGSRFDVTYLVFPLPFMTVSISALLRRATVGHT